MAIKSLAAAKKILFTDDAPVSSLAAVKSAGPVAVAKSEVPVLPVKSIMKATLERLQLVEPKYVGALIPEATPAVMPVELPVEPPASFVPPVAAIDIGIAKAPESGGIAGGTTFEPKKSEDMGFLQNLVNKVVGVDKLTGDPAKDFAQISSTANKVIKTSNTVTGAIKGGLKALGTVIPGGALAAGAFDKLTGGSTGTVQAIPSGGPLAAAEIQLGGKAGPISIVYGDTPPTAGKMPTWLWPVVIIGAIVLLFAGKIFKRRR